MLLLGLQSAWLPFHGGVLVGFLTTFLLLHGLLLPQPVPGPSRDPQGGNDTPGPSSPPVLYGVAPEDAAGGCWRVAPGGDTGDSAGKGLAGQCGGASLPVSAPFIGGR